MVPDCFQADACVPYIFFFCFLHSSRKFPKRHSLHRNEHRCVYICMYVYNEMMCVVMMLHILVGLIITTGLLLVDIDLSMALLSNQKPYFENLCWLTRISKYIFLCNRALGDIHEYVCSSIQKCRKRSKLKIFPFHHCFLFNCHFLVYRCSL